MNDIEIAMHRTIEARQADRERIARETEAYLAAGGRITLLPPPPDPGPRLRW